MMTDNLLFLRGPNSSVYILVLFQRSTGASAIHEILSGRIQQPLSEVLEEESPILTISDLKKHTFFDPEDLEEESPILTISDLKKHTFFDPEDVEALLREIETEPGTTIALDSLSSYNDEDNSATFTSLLRRASLRKERLKKEFRERKLDLACFQALKKIRNALEEVVSSPDIPDAEKAEFINKTTSHAVEIFQARQKGVQFEESIQQKAQTLQKKGVIFSHQPKQEKAVQPPDLSKIPLWRGRDLDGRALDYLKTHYGQYLSAFGAEQNNVFQDQIRAHDPKLMRGVGNQLQEEGKGRKVKDFVKPRSARTELELETFDLDTLKKAHRIKGFLRRRRLKGSDT
jgi:hypothetical protein